ncbi:hypothetical protein B0H14DRAFT_3877700 [Mycena olivaceomarginata]|nr:hypothetical protein B0H14DRAFT_3877700 [Mycena olivaceomarginata]
MSTNVAIIDDRDPLLRYSTGWNNSGSFVEFAGTARWSGIPGSTASLAFSGSSVIIYGSVAANPSEASLSFSVDGSLAGSYSPSPSTTALHHQVLWASPPLHDETHILFITQTTASESGSGVIFLDYIMYNTTSRPENTTFFIDDRDPQHTSSESTVPGDAFTLEFEGTSISYYGGLTTSDTDTTIAEIVLDGGATTMYTAPSKIPATTNNLIYKSGELEAGNHTLVVTSTNSATLWADYFLVTASPGGSMQTESAPFSALPSSARSKSPTNHRCNHRCVLGRSGSLSATLPGRASTHPPPPTRARHEAAYRASGITRDEWGHINGRGYTWAFTREQYSFYQDSACAAYLGVLAGEGGAGFAARDMRTYILDAR